MKIKWKKLLLCLAIPLGVGGLSALISGGGMKDFEMLAKPPLSPPGWLFPVAWTILYTLMGIACYLVVTADTRPGTKRDALIPYGIQLGINFFWSVLFFNFKVYFLALVWLVLLWIFILITLLRFARLHPAAGWLFVPYLAWVSFAAYLNAGVWLLN